ncbi:NCS1 nucleoside transporter [Colletotrichum sublineola]|uniref:Putative NCS1 nucleoside transporter n=1 Tax=Colletotrichum sublineola TaxID=1173701 RepID=A0A066X902_COLSU|nr:NCS1 nucleoside transporter [Colletotrichum sublineola]KDN65633.1 putative NCS1 nucleoside transporter [Colletotrichum sublineola]
MADIEALRPTSTEGQPHDEEKGYGTTKTENDHGTITSSSLFQRALRLVRVEEQGIEPIPLAERTSTRYLNVFTVWCSMNANILPITFGMLGPSLFGLNLRDSSLVVLFFTLLSTLAPAFLATLGPKTGMRSMIQARFSFGRYLVSVPVVFNLATLTGFCIIICVVGGQCLSAVTNGALSPDLGIVLIALLSLLISFCGFKVLHFYETYAFIPAVIAIVIATGCGGSRLKAQANMAPATASSILSFGMIVSSYMIPWACIASDLTTYFDPRVRGASYRVFVYSYLGLILPTILLMTLGSAIGGAMTSVLEWQEGYNSTLVGEVLAAMLAPAGGFGKFVVVVLAFTLLGNISGTMYAITLNFQTLVPWLVRVPRYVFSIVVTAVMIPVAIKAADDFFLNLENFVALIGYWSASFVGIVVVEHFVFRKGDAKLYDPRSWNVTSSLPSGAAALGVGILSFGLVVPCMAQAWWTGPIANTTGDIGFEVAFILSALFYLPLRWLERRVLHR